MAIVASSAVVLATAVASPAGTFTVGYPSGYAQADFTGLNAKAASYMIVNDNDRYEEADDEFDISFGSTNITVTNKTGASLAAGASIVMGLAHVGPVAADLAALTDNSGGTASTTIAAVPGTYTQATLAAQIATLTQTINQIVAVLKNL